MHDAAITLQFLLWSELCALWALLAYTVAQDPMPEDVHNPAFPWRNWRILLLVRLALCLTVAYFLSHSIVIAVWLGTVIVLHPWIRFRSPRKWTAEFEVIAILLNLFFTLSLVSRLALAPEVAVPNALNPAQLAALSLVAAILFFSLRGGTYIVRACLRKTGTLPHLHAHDQSATESKPAREEGNPPKGKSAPGHVPSSALASDKSRLDLAEMNRGRLIGNLERLILAIVVAAGSYAALGFLVAAKGLVRFDELRDREFAEYFLVGSLASVLVALCAGMAIRYVLLSFWPGLIPLHMQGS